MDESIRSTVANVCMDRARRGFFDSGAICHDTLGPWFDLHFDRYCADWEALGFKLMKYNEDDKRFIVLGWDNGHDNKQ
jgi:hypothetical protein